ncbi:hypothetical protein [Mycoplasma sp. CSL7503-lung]|uniref:hypothetical protein n=1 Tax=Mycoplasma sp. CSL7503-lung TaxID=536372 RepID=UPI0021D2DBCB|nr:hypothetical protein [Mycoplasma sp. CSL7503-lung]MCU4706985.1 hypothetical protein [Mycoplasma sp. CSL7503-lung]
MKDKYFDILKQEIETYKRNVLINDFLKINVYFNNLDSTKLKKLINIKVEHINHLLGIHYFRQFTNNKKMRDFSNVLDYFAYHKYNWVIIEKQYNKSFNKPKLKFRDLLFRFLSYFKIINILYDSKKRHLNQVFYKLKEEKLGSTHFLKFEIWKNVKVCFLLKNITREQYTLDTYKPISILINNENKFLYEENTICENIVVK